MYIFIINPMAGDGRAKHIFAELQQTELYRSIDKKYYYTEYPSQAENLVQNLIKAYGDRLKGFIAIGGDGTVHEVLNSLHHTVIPVVFIPGGSGNDFAKGMGIKGSPKQIFIKALLNSNQSVPYWLGNYDFNGISRKVVNSIGFGFDAEITKKANQAKFKKMFNTFGFGNVSYLFALLHVLRKFKPKSVRIRINGNTRFLKDCWMVAIGNHPYYGGGLKILPHAETHPEKMYGLIVHSLPKWKVLFLFLTVIFGWHGRIKEVELFEAETFEIYSESSLCYQVDGQTGTTNECRVKKDTKPVSIIGS